MTPRVQVACLFTAVVTGGILLSAIKFIGPRPVDRGFKDADLSGVEFPGRADDVMGRQGDYSTGSREYEVSRNSGQEPRGRRVEWKDDYAIVEAYYCEGIVITWNKVKVIPSRSDRLRDFVWGLWR